MTPQLKAALREKIKQIVLGDAPDHFYSDDMLQMPDRILDLLQPEIKRLVVEARIEENEWFRDVNPHYSMVVNRIDKLTQQNQKEGK